MIGKNYHAQAVTIGNRLQQAQLYRRSPPVTACSAIQPGQRMAIMVQRNTMHDETPRFLAPCPLCAAQHDSTTPQAVTTGNRLQGAAPGQRAAGYPTPHPPGGRRSQVRVPAVGLESLPQIKIFSSWGGGGLFLNENDSRGGL